MKKLISILFFGFLMSLFTGCSKPSAGVGSPQPAIDLIQPGKRVTWDGGDTLYVAKRDGSSISGVQITTGVPSGETRTFKAESGTIKQGPPGTVHITLTNASVQAGAGSSTNIPGNLFIELHR